MRLVTNHFVHTMALVLAVCLFCCPVWGYSVLTHEQVVDLSKELNLVLPHQVHDLLVGQNRIAPHWTAKEAHSQYECHRMHEVICHQSHMQVADKPMMQAEAYRVRLRLHVLTQRVRNASLGRGTSLAGEKEKRSNSCTLASRSSQGGCTGVGAVA